ncbi:MAG: ABC transporter substrate-binding protein [Rhizobiales bacterium]|nr:ABC transporter substrate-binding protein [Hyphomicrobiales bacterium]
MRAGSVALALSLTLGMASVEQAAAEEIRIGFVGPLSGPAAALGIQTRQGVELAIEEINAAGGVPIAGKPLKLEALFEDSASKPEVGVSAAQKLLTRDKVDFLVADTIASSVTFAVMDLASSFNIPMMSAQPVSSAISDKIAKDPEKYKNFWKGDWNSDEYGRIVFDFTKWIIEKKTLVPKNKSIAFVVEDTDYGRSNAQVAIELFKKEGWNTSTYEVVPLGYSDFYPQIAKLRTVAPDVIVSAFTSGNSGVAFARQLKESAVPGVVIGLAYPGYPEFLPQARAAADGFVWAPFNFDSKNDPKQKAFSETFRAKYKVDASNESVWGYCFTKVIADVFRRAAQKETATLVKAIAATDYVCDVYGRWVFDEKNHTAKAGSDYLALRVGQIWNGESRVIFPERLATTAYRPR